MDYNDLLTTFTYYSDSIQSYYDEAHNVANSILWVLLLLEIVFFGFRMMLGDYNSLQSIVKKILSVGVMIYIIQNIDNLALSFTNTLQKMGASVHNYSFDYLENPLYLLRYVGYELFAGLLGEIQDILDVSLLNIVKVIPAAIILILVFLCAVVCILVIVVLLCLVQLEFYFLLLLAIILMPFHINEHTKFISSQAISVVMFQGIRLLSISLVTGLVIESFKVILTKALDVGEIDIFFLIYLVIHITLGLYLILQSGSIIQAFMPGASTGNSPLQQVATLAGAGFSAYSIVKNSKGIAEKIGSTVQQALPSLPSAESKSGAGSGAGGAGRGAGGAGGAGAGSAGSAGGGGIPIMQRVKSKNLHNDSA